jgi:hypothetical protein
MKSYPFVFATFFGIFTISFLSEPAKTQSIENEFNKQSKHTKICKSNFKNAEYEDTGALISIDTNLNPLDRDKLNKKLLDLLHQKNQVQSLVLKIEDRVLKFRINSNTGDIYGMSLRGDNICHTIKWCNLKREERTFTKGKLTYINKCKVQDDLLIMYEKGKSSRWIVTRSIFGIKTTTLNALWNSKEQQNLSN